MLLKLLLKLTALLLTGILLAGGATLVAGKQSTDPILIVTITTPPVGNLGLYAIDLERGLQHDISMPVNGVRDVILSPDGSRALLISGGMLPRLHVYDFASGDVFTTGTTHDLIPNRPPHWSPDSNQLVFYESFIPDDGDQGVHILNFEERRIRQATGSVVQAYWSPDGSRIGFTLEGDVFIADGETTRNVTRNNLWHYNMQWLDDATLVFAGLNFANNQQRFFAMDADADENAEPRVISGEHTVRSDTPIIATDARQVLFTVEETLYVADLDTNSLERAVSMDDPIFDADTRLISGAWTLNDTYLLAYTADAADIPTVHVTTWIHENDTWRQLLPETLVRSWSPDSRYVLHTRLDDATRAYDVLLMDVLADETRQLHGTASYIDPSWSEDGRYLVYILRENVPNGRRTRFTSRLYGIKMPGEEAGFLTGQDEYIVSFAFQD